MKGISSYNEPKYWNRLQIYKRNSLKMFTKLKSTYILQKFLWKDSFWFENFWRSTRVELYMLSSGCWVMGCGCGVWCVGRRTTFLHPHFDSEPELHSGFGRASFEIHVQTNILCFLNLGQIRESLIDFQNHSTTPPFLKMILNYTVVF